MALEIFADGVLSIGEEDIFIQSRDANLIIDLPSLRTGLTLIRAQPVRSERVKLIADAQKWLTFADLDVHVQLVGRTIARLGARARPGLTSRLLGFGQLELRPVSLLFSWWRRRRAMSF